MKVHASHQGIQFEISQVRTREWRWSFDPPTGARRSGRVVGRVEWAMTVARRAIEIWHQMNPSDRSQAA